MEDDFYNSNIIFNKLVQNSLFTSRQISIIYTRLNKEKTRDNISSGAYYRQIHQCKTKIKKLLYSIILLRLINAVDNEIFSVFEQLISQLNVVLSDNHSDIIDNSKVDNVIYAIDNILNKLSKL